MYCANSSQKKAGVARLIVVGVDFREKNITRDKGLYYQRLFQND